MDKNICISNACNNDKAGGGCGHCAQKMLDGILEVVLSEQSSLIDLGIKKLLEDCGYRNEIDARNDGYELITEIEGGIGGKITIKMCKVVKTKVIPQIKIKIDDN